MFLKQKIVWFWLINFPEGAVLPRDYLTGPDNPTIRFIKQVRTYTCSPHQLSFVNDCNPAINSGTIVKPPSYW